MGTIITLANHKGGVGKTSMIMNLGGSLSQLGYSVLLIDLDSQCNLSSVFFDHQVGNNSSVMDLILNEIPYDQVIHKTAFKQISIIPATIDLRELDNRLAGEDDAQYFLPW